MKVLEHTLWVTYSKVMIPTFRRFIKKLRSTVSHINLSILFYVSFVTYITDPFVERMQFVKYKDQYDDLIDDA